MTPQDNETTRLEAFSDGVLAIIITLLVFGIVPHVGDGHVSMFFALPNRAFRHLIQNAEAEQVG